MTPSPDPTDAIRREAVKLAGVAKGSSCNQSSFKTDKGAFLFLGPGRKGQGFKAMFKLEASIPQARKLAEQSPQRFEVGTTGWVTARFSAEDPLPKPIWSRWLAESYELTCGAGSAQKSTPRRTKKPRS